MYMKVNQTSFEDTRRDLYCPDQVCRICSYLANVRRLASYSTVLYYTSYSTYYCVVVFHIHPRDNQYRYSTAVAPMYR
jgi:hypothetical protein